MTENNENREKTDVELASAPVDEQAQEQAEEAIEQHKNRIVSALWFLLLFCCDCGSACYCFCIARLGA